MNDQENTVEETEPSVAASETAETPKVSATVEAAPEETPVSDSPSVSRRWLRHPTKRVFGGVCGGLADYLGMSEGLIRLVVMGLIFLTAGTAIALYLLFWVFLPVGTQEEGQTADPVISLRAKHGRWFAYGIIGLGALLLASNLGLFQLATSVAYSVGHIFLVPGLFILVGFLILRRFHNKALREDFKGFRTQAKAASSTAKRWGDKVRTKPMGLHRSRRDRVLAGVCGGLGEKLSVDPLLMRMAYIIVAVMTGFVLMAALYLALAILLPVSEEKVETVSEPPTPLATV